jgi:hypothetical protein
MTGALDTFILRGTGPCCVDLTVLLSLSCTNYHLRRFRRGPPSQIAKKKSDHEGLGLQRNSGAHHYAMSNHY